MITSTKKRIRGVYTPLNISVSIKCDSAFSPLMQVYNALLEEHEPDRRISPCIISPIIQASSSDGSWEHDTINHLLSLDRLYWYVNGTLINTISSWNGLYSIDNSNTNDRGSISIMRNLLPSQTFSLHFEGEFADPRLGTTIRVKTDPVILSCIDKSKDSYTMSIGADKNIRYSAFDDKLLEYEYKVAHGIIEASAEEENLARNGNEYERTIPIQVYQAGQVLSDGYSVKLFKQSNFNLTELTPMNSEIISINPTAIVFDLRLIEKENYVIKAYLNGNSIASLNFGIERIYRAFTCTPTNETSIAVGQIEKYDKAKVCCNGKTLLHPSYAISISWFTDTATKQAVKHNAGQEACINLASTGIGNTYLDDWIDVYTTAAEKGVFDIATNGSDTFVDSNNNTYIFK